MGVHITLHSVAKGPVILLIAARIGNGSVVIVQTASDFEGSHPQVGTCIGYYLFYPAKQT